MAGIVLYSIILAQTAPPPKDPSSAKPLSIQATASGSVEDGSKAPLLGAPAAGSGDHSSGLPISTPGTASNGNVRSRNGAY